MLDHLPTEIFIRILLKLPVESLIQCTAVCRSWHFLITCPSFIQRPLLHTASDRRTVLLRNFSKGHLALHSDPSSVVPFKVIKSPLKRRSDSYARLVGSLHGLVCMTDDISFYANKTVLWNPSIRKHIELPRPSFTFSEVGPHYLTLGFGYDRSTDDYKVVRVVYADKSDGCSLPPLAEVYTIKEKAWKKVNAVGVESVDSYMLGSSWTQCFLQGRVHWIGYGDRTQGVVNSVLMFDMGDEKFRKMKLPNNLNDVHPKHLSVSEIGGFLTILNYYYVGAELKRHCDIWRMKVYDDMNSWSKMYTVDGLGASGIVLGLTGKDEILLVKDYEELHYSMFFWCQISNGEIISYNPKTHETWNFGMAGITDARCYLWYSESLVLLDKDSGASSDRKNDEQHEQRSVTRGQAESNADQVYDEEGTSGSATDD